MHNYRSVSTKGAVKLSRARALWYDSRLKVFDVNGLVLDIEADEPKRRPRHIRVWDVETARGAIVMRGKCMTCGGKAWLAFMRIPASELWSREQ